MGIGLILLVIVSIGGYILFAPKQQQYVEYALTGDYYKCEQIAAIAIRDGFYGSIGGVGNTCYIAVKKEYEQWLIQQAIQNGLIYRKTS